LLKTQNLFVSCPRDILNMSASTTSNASGINGH
jgi:hypothetical protein